MPRLLRQDQPADELTVHVLSPPTRRATRTPHASTCHQRSPPLPPPTMLRPRVLPIDRSPRPIRTTPRAKPRMRSKRLELPRAEVAAANAARNATEHMARPATTSATRTADGLVAVRRIEPEPAPRTRTPDRAQLDTTPTNRQETVVLAANSGREIQAGGHGRASCSKRPASPSSRRLSEPLDVRVELVLLDAVGGLGSFPI
jgi:hypothetical protein